MGTASMYCKNDPIVTIYIRDELNPSPNTSRAVSHATSLNERRKISGQHQSPDVIIREPKRNTFQSLDIISREPVRSLPVEDQVIIDQGQARQNHFRRTISTGKTIMIQKNAAIEALKQDDQFEINSKLFIRDLQTFGSDVEAQKRSHSTGSRFYLGTPYFNQETVQKIKTLPVGDDTLEGKLNKLWEKKTAQGELDEICASHDLAPLFGAAFGIDWKNLKGEILKDIANLSLGDQKGS
ncbi:MAG: hypothetical protein Q9225_003288 [Loekoesia sp. 1 TL-2023]